MSKVSTGNHITLLRNGAEFFPALEAAIDSARYEVHLQTYIFELDDIGLKIGEVLKNAVQRGVRIYLLLDGFGSKELPKTYVRSLTRAGVEVLFYRPKISPWTFKRSRLRRMHRKVTVVDGHTAFVGGINIIDDYNTPPNEAPRIDYAVQVQGPLVSEIHDSAARLWKIVCRAHLRRVRKSSSRDSFKLDGAGEVSAKYLLRDPLWHRSAIEDAYLAAIRAAKSNILIANAYFLPGLKFRRALKDAAARGVKVVLLLQGRVEIFLIHHASHALYTAFLQQDIEIYEYRKSFMHSKVAVIDDTWAMVGSSNIDPFSLFMAREANIEIYNPAFAKELKQDLQQTIASGAELITYESWQHQNSFKRTLSWAIYGFVRHLISLVGFSRYY